MSKTKNKRKKKRKGEAATTNDNFEAYKPAVIEVREPLYHITDARNRDDILADGLRSRDDGTILTFSQRWVTEDVAMIKLGEDREYALFEIDPTGIDGPVFEDVAMEITALLHRLVKQPFIEARYVSHLGDYTQCDKLSEFYYLTCYLIDGWRCRNVDLRHF